LDDTGPDEHRAEHRTSPPVVTSRGRGNKFMLAPEHLPKVLRAIRRGASEVSIARSLGINYRTWLRVKAEDEEIASVLSESRKMEEDELVSLLMDKAREKDVSAIAFALRTRHHYRDHGSPLGQGDQKVNIQINLPAAQPSMDDYMKTIHIEGSAAS
jgi:hypothetical protein